jgi:photosystem II stability/assembly factor-like uncharacterized protein
MKSLPPRALLAHCSILSLALMLSACNDGGSGTAVTPRSSASMLVATTIEADSANCAAGGVKISSGADTNGDGILDTSEVANVQYACNGASGAGSIVKTVALTAGDAHCPSGGDAVEVGTDTNGNGVLDASEIVSTAYVCQGVMGATGANGAVGSHGIAGANSVINIAALAAGATCQYGGYTITAGPDDGSGHIASVTSTAHICDGAPGADVNWVDVTGTSQQAQSNTGYLADNPARVTITLPASPAIGDLIRVSGAGTGGWSIAQNAGQTVRTQGIPTGSNVWTLQAGGGQRRWQAIASSADGSHLAAVDSFQGYIYTSSDTGVTWTQQTGSGQHAWTAIASSSDGTHLAATDGSLGYVYTSADSGATWAQRTGSGQLYWSSIASSADGSRLVAADSNNGYIYTSTDSGVTWAQGASGQHQWTSLSSSADGLRLVAGSKDNGMMFGFFGYLFTSMDAGATWTAQASGGQRGWFAVASSVDGVHLAAVDNGGYIYTSADSGVTWTQRSGSGQHSWFSIASSADGSELAAVERGGYIYTSVDSGVSWTQNVGGGSRAWTAIASSSDGSHLAAVEYGGYVYTEFSESETTVGTGGTLSGVQYDMIELQYLGNGVFGVLSYTLDTGNFTIH